MKFREKIISEFYAGQNKEFFYKHRDEIHLQNSKIIGVLIILFSIVFAIFSVLTALNKSGNIISITYAVSSLLFIVLHIIFEFSAKKSIIATKVMTNIILWCFFLILIFINLNITRISVYVPIFFIVVCNITISEPLYTYLGSLTALILFTVIDFQVKEFSVANYDVTNAIVSFVLGIIIGRTVLIERIHAIISLDVIKKLGGKEQFSMMTGLLDDFDNINYADFTTNDFITYRSSKIIERNIGGWNETLGFNQRMQLYANSIILPEDRSYFLKCTEPKNIIRNLTYAPSFTVDYRVLLDGQILYYQTKFVSISENRYGVVMGTHNIDRETRLEFERVEQKIIARQKEKEFEQQTRNLEIIKALSEEYTSVYHINLSTDKMIPFRTDKNMAEMYNNLYHNQTGYTATFKLFINDCVIEEDKQSLLEFCDVENLKQELTLKQGITKRYRSTINGLVEYFELKFVKVGNNETPENVILGIANKDYEIRAEKEREEELKLAKNQAEAASRSKSSFLSRMSHDIRTPINGVMGMTEIAKKNIENPQKLKDCLEKIDAASEHLLGLVNDVLDMSRIENGKINIISAPFNMSELAENCCSILDSQILERKLTLTKEFETIKHSNLVGDELHLRQILINILGNSLKFTPVGGKIHFKVEETDYKDNVASFCIEISDTGIGMKKDFISHIWDAFSQENINYSTTTGTGLGMAITKSLIDLMGGEISVESEPNKGTKFTINISLAIQEETEEKNSNNNSFIELKGKRILLVEDNELNIEIAKDLLEDEGLIITTAENGKIAIEKFSSSEEGFYDAILMDVMMPVMDGLEATKNIRAFNRIDSCVIPIIAMTANAFDSDTEKSLEAGMNAHLTKPLRIEILKKVLSSLISEK